VFEDVAVARNAFDEDGAGENRYAITGDIESPQDKLLAELEWRVRNYPVERPRSERAAQEVTDLSVAIAMGVGGRNGPKIFSQNLCHMASTTGGFEASLLVQVMPTVEDVLNECPRRPGLRGEIVRAVNWLDALSHNRVRCVLHHSPGLGLVAPFIDSKNRR
jgi:hypothetical protein